MTVTASLDDIAIIMLAAGYSRRFRGDKRRALLPDGRSVLSATLDAVPSTFGQRLLVLQPGDGDLAAAFPEWRVVLAEDSARGMGASLAAAAKALQPARAALVALADMPWIATDTYAKVAQALEPGGIVVPAFEGRRGHPVGFAARFFPELARLDHDAGARSVLSTHPDSVRLLPCEDPGILRDVDRREDLEGNSP